MDYFSFLQCGLVHSPSQAMAGLAKGECHSFISFHYIFIQSQKLNNLIEKNVFFRPIPLAGMGTGFPALQYLRWNCYKHERMACLPCLASLDGLDGLAGLAGLACMPCLATLQRVMILRAEGTFILENIFGNS